MIAKKVVNNMSTFKDILKQDNLAFFNSSEFAESHIIDNIEKVIIIDNDKIKEVSIATNQGISLGEILYSIPIVDVNKVPHVRDSQTFDKKLMFISSVSEDMGLYEIILTQRLGD